MCSNLGTYLFFFVYYFLFTTETSLLLWSCLFCHYNYTLLTYIICCIICYHLQSPYKRQCCKQQMGILISGLDNKICFVGFSGHPCIIKVSYQNYGLLIVMKTVWFTFWKWEFQMTHFSGNVRLGGFHAVFSLKLLF